MTPVYSIEGKQIQLEGGLFESEDGTVFLLETVSGDLDGDAANDQAAVLVLNSRGSGVFYYLNVLLGNDRATYGRAKEAFIGDRIKFDFMDIYGAGSVSRLTGIPINPADHGQLVVGYYTRRPGQAYAESPGLYVTRRWTIENGRLVAVENR